MQDDGIITNSVAKLGVAHSTALLEALVVRLHRRDETLDADLLGGE